jgi:type II secretory ATPase GspE/PulE/Tfp pilus assembly ATPase PilB-like protein
MAGNVIGILAQRLIRKLCKYCKVASRPTKDELHLLSNREGKIPKVIYKPKGCTTCDNTGYKGRLALLEILKMNSELDDLLSYGATTKEIREAANRQGFLTLADDGIRNIINGITSIDEVTRVANLTERMT